MKLPVYLYGHPVLREISEDITPDYPGLKQLVADMFETMYASDGVGLAAPQIGRNDRIVVIDASPVAENFPECDGWKKALINPEIEILDGDMVSRSEGCLSLWNTSACAGSTRISSHMKRKSRDFWHASYSTNATISRGKSISTTSRQSANS